MEYYDLVDDYIKKEMEILDSLDRTSICTALEVLLEAYEEEREIYVFGNGGSSATASHFVNDFNKGVSENLEKKFKFNCLNDNVPTIMAIANDIGFEEVFRYQLVNKIQANDVVIAISGSGNSENIIRAAEYAKDKGAYVIGLTGYDGGSLYTIADLNLHIDVNSMQISEDIAMIYNHLMMSVLCRVLCGKDHLGNE